MLICESEAKKKMCPFLGSQCLGRDCMAWKFVQEGDGRHPAFRMTQCAGLYFDEHQTECQEDCSSCKHRPGRCIRLHPVDPYAAKRKQM